MKISLFRYLMSPDPDYRKTEANTDLALSKTLKTMGNYSFLRYN